MPASDGQKHPRGGNPLNTGEFSPAGNTPHGPPTFTPNTDAWPSIDYEEQTWQSKMAEWGVRGSLASRDSGTYRSAVPAFIASLDVAVSKDAEALAEDATAELVRFDASLGGGIAPFSSLLLRSEAVASSQIEQLTASARAILTAELSADLARSDEPVSTSHQHADMIAANTRAMKAALALADDLTVDTVLNMHRVLMDKNPHHAAGQWREEPVWIGTRGLSPIGATYVAPDYRRVPGLIADLMEFARRDDIARLTQVAVTHAHFETIHPFTDGNGRTGRALMQAMLRGTRVTRNVTVPISAGMLTDTAGYHASLTAYRAGDVDGIVRLTAESAFRAVQNASTLVNDLRRVRESWNDSVKARSDSTIWRVLDSIARNPVVTASSLAGDLSISVQNTYPHLNKLTEAGILRAKNEYRRGTIWRADEILAELDAFAARSGRRG